MSDSHEPQTTQEKALPDTAVTVQQDEASTTVDLQLLATPLDANPDDLENPLLKEQIDTPRKIQLQQPMCQQEEEGEQTFVEILTKDQGPTPTTSPVKQLEQPAQSQAESKVEESNTLQPPNEDEHIKDKQQQDEATPSEPPQPPLVDETQELIPEQQSILDGTPVLEPTPFITQSQQQQFQQQQLEKDQQNETELVQETNQQQEQQQDLQNADIVQEEVQSVEPEEVQVIHEESVKAELVHQQTDQIEPVLAEELSQVIQEANDFENASKEANQDDIVMLMSQPSQPLNPQPLQILKCSHLSTATPSTSSLQPLFLCQICFWLCCQECFFSQEVTTQHLHASNNDYNIVELNTLLRSLNQQLQSLKQKLVSILNRQDHEKQKAFEQRQEQRRRLLEKLHLMQAQAQQELFCKMQQRGGYFETPNSHKSVIQATNVGVKRLTVAAQSNKIHWYNQINTIQQELLNFSQISFNDGTRMLMQQERKIQLFSQFRQLEPGLQSCLQAEESEPAELKSRQSESIRIETQNLQQQICKSEPKSPEQQIPKPQQDATKVTKKQKRKKQQQVFNFGSTTVEESVLPITKAIKKACTKVAKVKTQDQQPVEQENSDLLVKRVSNEQLDPPQKVMPGRPKKRQKLSKSPLKPQPPVLATQQAAQQDLTALKQSILESHTQHQDTALQRHSEPRPTLSQQSSQIAQQVASSGHQGKDLSHLMMFKKQSQTKQIFQQSEAISSTLLVKLLNHKALAYNLQQQELQMVKIPELILPKTTLVLTSLDQIILLGGEQRGTFKGNCHIWHLSSQSFTASLQQMPQPRVHFGALYCMNQVFCVGGWHNSYTQQCHAYLPQDDKWQTLPSLKNEMSHPSLCAVNDKWIYAIGEVCTRGKRAKVVQGSKKTNFWQYMIERMPCQSPLEWEEIYVQCAASISEQPSFKNMGVFQHYTSPDQLVLFGGATGQNLHFQSYQLDLTSLQITDAAGSTGKGELAKSDKFANHLFFRKDDSLYCFGEHYLHRYDLQRNKWSQDDVMALTA